MKKSQCCSVCLRHRLLRMLSTVIRYSPIHLHEPKDELVQGILFTRLCYQKSDSPSWDRSPDVNECYSKAQISPEIRDINFPDKYQQRSFVHGRHISCNCTEHCGCVGGTRNKTSNAAKLIPFRFWIIVTPVNSTQLSQGNHNPNNQGQTLSRSD